MNLCRDVDLITNMNMWGLANATIRMEKVKFSKPVDACCQWWPERSVMRDTGSTTVCMVKSTLVKPEQMTGSYDWCVLIDGTMKRYPTAVVGLDTPYYAVISKVLCMETPIQDVIIGNTPGALGAEPRCQIKTVNTIVKPGVSNTQSQKMKDTGNNPEPSEAGNEQNDDTSRQSVVTAETNATETFATIQSRSVDTRGKTKLPELRKL